MKRHTTRLNQREQELAAQQQQSVGQQSVIEFATAEKMLRHDSDQTPVPAAVAERLRKSVEAEPKPARSWWQRLFGGKRCSE